MKETQLSVLKEIRDLLKERKSISLEIEKASLLPVGNYRTLHIPKGATIEGTLAECKKLFPVWRYTDKNLDETITSDRNTEKAYDITFKNVQEADEDQAKKSANDLKGLKTITLLERLVMELDYFKETGKHLDIENWTLCAGSRDPDGRVPCVDWSVNELFVGWTSVARRSSSLRARVAVS